jgi:hypothetical protein
VEENEIQKGLEHNFALSKSGLYPFFLGLPGFGECNVDIGFCVCADGGEVAACGGIVADDLIGASGILMRLCMRNRFVREMNVYV